MNLKKIIVLNLGSTSFKYKLFEFGNGEKILSAGEVESIGCQNSHYKIRIGADVYENNISCASHNEAFRFCIDFLKQNGVLMSLTELDAVGYKAVHGGVVNGAQLVDDTLMDIMDSFASFAPAHNPVYSRMMRYLQKKYPMLRQVACFETSFHASIPDYRVVYGIPNEWREQYGIRRYGFHGSSHSYITHRINELSPTSKKVISVHLGGSSSLCAIKNGQSIATSMGATPQSGVFHNNRVGDFDVFCLPKLVEEYHGDLDLVMKKLSSESGFLGLSGISNDLRVVLNEQQSGNENADLAVKSFVDNIVGYIGMFTAYLNGLDALIFTGGIGKRSPIIRAMVCECLFFLSLELDPLLNSDLEKEKISSENSKVSVWALETNEELMVAMQTNSLINSIESCDT